MTKELSTLLSQVHYFFICHLSFFLDMEATGGFARLRRVADLSLSHSCPPSAGAVRRG
jgi:hypothetical protein